MNVFNEIDPYAAEWLRNLGADRVLEKSIADVAPEDLHDATRFHTFAGIGLWEYALQLAGWPADVPVWTGSCPCQPFSTAGKGKGKEDPRHLWPDWRKLIEICRPPILFGEQVASPAGRDWLDTVSADLEALGYAVGAADLCAAGVGAPHIRQRIFFIARSGELGDANRYGSRRHPRTISRAETESNRSREEARRLAHESESSGAARELAYSDSGNRRQIGTHLRGGAERSETKGLEQRFSHGSIFDAWADAEWVPCSDGKARPIEPGTFPLAHGDPGRVGKLRAYGNAIVPQAASTFILASMDVLFPKK